MSASTLVEPAFLSLPTWDYTLGDEVADLCSMVGYAPDPEQGLLLDAIFGYSRATRLPVAFETCVVAPRQNIKTGLFKQCVLGWLFLTDERLVVWSAHEFPTAREAFRDISELIDGSEMLSKRVRRIYSGSGAEAVELTNGCRLVFKARTKTGGRGLTGRKVVLDEGFALQQTHMGALIPTLSTKFSAGAQVVIGSSAGLLDSEILRGLRDRGRPGGDPRLIYAEWCDDLPGECAAPSCDHDQRREGCRLDDPARWMRANSQAGRRISMDYIADERRLLPPREFARERHGWWDEPDGSSVFPPSAWEALTDPTSHIDGLPVFGIDVSPDRSRLSIGVAGHRDDGLAHVEVVDNDPMHAEGGIIARCSELQATHGGLGFVIDQGSAAGSLIQPLTDAGLTVITAGSRDYAQACGAFFDAVTGKTLRHQGEDQPELSTAVRGARQRTLGDAWAWDRKHPGVDITPLVAVTLALWGLAQQPEISPSVVIF